MRRGKGHRGWSNMKILFVRSIFFTILASVLLARNSIPILHEFPHPPCHWRHMLYPIGQSQVPEVSSEQGGFVPFSGLNYPNRSTQTCTIYFLAQVRVDPGRQIESRKGDRISVASLPLLMSLSWPLFVPTPPFSSCYIPAILTSCPHIPTLTNRHWGSSSG